MKKDAFYFPHDTNAIADPKMINLLAECGLVGIGMYWILIEHLHQQPDGKIDSMSFKNLIKLYYKFNQTNFQCSRCSNV